MHKSKNKTRADLKIPPFQEVVNDTVRPLSLRQDDPEAIKSVRRAIESAAMAHLDLLNEIQRTRNAVYVVENNRRTISYLEEELKEQTKLCEEAAQATTNQLQKCRKAGIATPKNWNRKSTDLIGPTPDAKQAYYQALAIQSKAEQRAKELKVDFDNVERETAAVIDQAERNGEAQKKIEEIYSQIFDGKTPGFADEDELEERYQTQHKEHSETAETLEATRSACKWSYKLPVIFDRIDKNIDEARSEMERSHRFSGVSYVAVLVERAGDLISMAQARLQETLDKLPQPHTPEFTKDHEKLALHLTTARSCAVSTTSVSYTGVTKEAANYAIKLITSEIEHAREVHGRLTKILRRCEVTASSAFQATGRSLNQAKESLTAVRQSIFEEIGHVASAPPYRQHDSEDNPIIDASGLPPPPIYSRSRS